MKKCAVCRHDITANEPAVLFIDSEDNPVEICETCEHQLDMLMNSDDLAALKTAVNYLHQCEQNNPDKEISDHLRSVIDENYDRAVELKESVAPVDVQNAPDYFSERDDAPDSIKKASGMGWVSGLKVLTWIVFTVLVIASFVIGAKMIDIGNDIGFLLLLGGPVFAFLQVAFTMVLLHAAENIGKSVDNTREIYLLLSRGKENKN